MRELSPDVLPRDHLTIWMPAPTWNCAFCEPDGGDGAGTTVDWLGWREGDPDGPDGRCRECGCKFRLARWREHVPSIAEQLRGAP